MSLPNYIRAEKAVAKKLEDAGYTVFFEPPQAMVPFPLDGYRPDILATKNGEHLIVEVKSAGSRTQPEKYLELANRVHQHPGWKFSLVTVQENEFVDTEPTPKKKLDADEVQKLLHQIDQAIAAEINPVFLIPQLWVILIAAIEEALVKQQVALNTRITDLSILNLAYTHGVLSHADFENAKRLMVLRNQAVHAIRPEITLQDFSEFRKLIRLSLDKAFSE